MEPFEILIADGHSRDDTLKVAQQFQKVKIIGFAKGVGKARRMLTEHASGGIIAWVDADVLLPSNWLESHLQLHSANKHVLMLSGKWPGQTIPPDGDITDISCEPTPLREGGTLTQMACTMKKGIFSLVNYDRRFRVAEDWDFTTSADRIGIRSFSSDGLLMFHIRRPVSRKFRVRFALYSGNYVVFLKKYGLWYIKYDPRRLVSFVVRIAMLYALPLAIILSPFTLLVYPIAWVVHSAMYKMITHPFRLLVEMVKGVGEHLYLLKIL